MNYTLRSRESIRTKSLLHGSNLANAISAVTVKNGESDILVNVNNLKLTIHFMYISIVLILCLEQLKTRIHLLCHPVREPAMAFLSYLLLTTSLKVII